MANKRIVIDDSTITEILNVLVIKDGIVRADMDEIKSFELNNTEETSEVTGAGDVVLNRTKKNKAVEISGTSGLLNGGLMEIQTGGTQTYSATQKVLFADTGITVATGATTVETQYTAVGATNGEIGYIYVTHPTGESVRFEQAATADSTHFAYDPTTKKITLPTGAVTTGDVVDVYYTIEVGGTRLVNEATKYSTEAKIVVNCMAKDACGTEFYAQFIIARADFDGNFNISMGSDQTEHAFSAKAMKNKCAPNGENSLWEFVVYKFPEVAGA